MQQFKKEDQRIKGGKGPPSATEELKVLHAWTHITHPTPSPCLKYLEERNIFFRGVEIL